jgi:ubiquinone/menaquinone biosynthesis C-methylase UbiE
MLESLAKQIIAQLEQDYDHIAAHFSNTRHAAWPEFELLRALIEQSEHPTAIQLLDIGCGNGRLADSIPAVHYTGLDLSRQLLTLAQQRYPRYQFVHGSMLRLPFDDGQFDIVACVAALQHIPSQAYRRQAIDEMVRVLKPTGKLFMLNWNLTEQSQYQPHQAGADYDAGDYLIPWKNDQGEIQAKRYYHGFTVPELLAYAEQAGLQIIKNEPGTAQRNLVTIAEKP